MSAGRDVRIEKIQHIGAVYQILPAASQQRIPVMLRGRLNGLLARHAPFAGRDVELARLTDFVAERPRGYLLVTGQPGFGKTALLANWLGGRPLDATVSCYHFISRVDGIADEEFALLNLCQQLVAAHGLAGELPARTAELRTLYSTLLTTPPPGGKLVVILDGLEEALGWTPGPDLFPPALPDGVFVVCSASEMANANWLELLRLPLDGAETLPLGALGPSEIAELLASAGGTSAVLAGSAAAVRALYDVSKGDPFYLRFLIEDVQRGEISEANIGRQPVGVDRYLADWLAQLNQDVDLERDEIYDLLGIFTVAKGRLRVGELGEIKPSLRKGVLVNRALSGSLGRYLLGSPDEGYALWHLRFADYLRRTQFRPQELDDYLEALLAYCARWRQHRSQYALAHYALHLHELDRRDELFALVCREWMDAQFDRTHSHRAFSADVERAIVAAVAEVSPSTLTQLVRAALVYATLGSIAAGVPPVALGALARVGQEERALAYAMLIPDRERQIDAYGRIAVALHGSQRSAEVPPVLDQAIGLAEEMADWSYRIGEPGGRSVAPALMIVVRALIETEDHPRATALAERAVATASEIVDGQRDPVLAAVAAELARAGLIDLAVAAVETIGDPRERIEPRVAIVDALARDGRGADALAICEAIDVVWHRVPVLVALVEALAEAGEIATAAQAADRVALAAERAAEDWVKGPLVAQAARACARAGMSDRAAQLGRTAIELTARLPDRLEQGWARAGVARGLAQRGQVDEALRLTAILPAQPDEPSLMVARGWAAWAVATALARAGDMDRALTWAREADILRRTLHESGNTPLEFALPELESLNRDGWLHSSVGDVARVLARVGPLDRALAAAARIAEAADRVNTQREIVSYLVERGDVDGALEAADAIGDVSARARALAVVAAALADVGRNADAAAVADRSLAGAQTVDDPWPARWDLVEVVAVLADAGRYDHAEAVTDAISDPEVRAWAFVALGEALERAGKGERAVDAAARALVSAEAVSPDATAYLARTRVLRVIGDERVSLTMVPLQTLIGQGMQRALRSGRLLGPFSLADQSQSVSLLLPSAMAIMGQLGMDERAVQLVDGLVERAVGAGAAGSALGGDFLLAQATGALVSLGRVDRAGAVAQTIRSPWRAAHPLAAVAAALARAGRAEEAATMADRAVASTEALHGSAQYDDMIVRVAVAFAEVGLISRMLRTDDGLAELARHLRAKDGALRTVVRHLVDAGDGLRAAALTDHAASDVGDRAGEILGALGVLGRPERITALAASASDTVAALRNPAESAEAWIKLGGELAQTGELERAAAALDRAADAVPHVADPAERDRVRLEVVRRLAKIGRTARALAVVDTVEAPVYLAEGLLAIRLALAQAGETDRAIAVAHRVAEVAGRVSDPFGAAHAWLTAAQALGGVGEGQSAALALVQAFLEARLATRAGVLQIVGESVPLLSSIEGGDLLWHVHEALLEVDGWWSDRSEARTSRHGSDVPRGAPG